VDSIDPVRNKIGSSLLNASLEIRKEELFLISKAYGMNNKLAVSFYIFMK
jgi:hypothetical protein